MRVKYHHGTSTLLDATGQTVRFMYRLGNICDTSMVEASMRLWRWLARTVTRSLAPLTHALTCWNPSQVPAVQLGAPTATAGTLAYRGAQGHITHGHATITPWLGCQHPAGLERWAVTVAPGGGAAYGWPGRVGARARMPGRQGCPDGEPALGARARGRGRAWCAWARVGADAREG
jgi:hypothetical protein